MQAERREVPARLFCGSRRHNLPVKISQNRGQEAGDANAAHCERGEANKRGEEACVSLGFASAHMKRQRASFKRTRHVCKPFAPVVACFSYTCAAKPVANTDDATTIAVCENAQMEPKWRWP